MKTIGKLAVLMVVIVVASPALAGTLNVDCSKSETVAKALETAKPGDTIQVTGTCKETVTITTDRLILDGQGNAILDGGGGFTAGEVFEGVLTIDGARGVTITGFTVQKGPDGITCKRGASCIVRDTTMQDNADEGMQVSENATADLTDCTLRRNGEWGLVVFDNSSVVFHGSLISDNNGRDGIGIFGGSSAASYGEVTIQANNNAGHGINVFGNAIVGMGRSGGMMTLHNNKRHGVSLFNAASMFTDRGTINPENNAGHGVFVGGNSNLANFGATFLMKGNKEAGLAVYDGSSVIMNKSTITDNGTDVTLSFGARATLKGNTIGTTTCDKSSLIRGDTACPE